ncbi:MAG: alpha/beta fold hydrolase [Pseudomonadota bacterium]
MKYSEDLVASTSLSDGAMRNLHIWGSRNPGPLLLCVHGGMAHAGDYVTMGVSFRAYDYTTVSIELTGHQGQRRVIIESFADFAADVRAMIKYVATEYPNRPWFLVGHSMGALILSQLALSGTLPKNDPFCGFVFSSPYWDSAIAVPWHLRLLSGVVARMAPTRDIPIEDFVDYLTHDETITARHRQDEAEDVRAREVSARFGHELLKAQRFVSRRMGDWKDPLLLIKPGDDRLANTESTTRLSTLIPDQHLSVLSYPDNYHENFNELNREEVFMEMRDWMQQRIEENQAI